MQTLTIELDSETAAMAQSLAEERGLSVEAYLVELINEDKAVKQ